jgi:hypothetical protein
LLMLLMLTPFVQNKLTFSLWKNADLTLHQRTVGNA